MNRLFTLSFFFICLISNAQNFPEPNESTWVVDQEDILNDEQVSSRMLDWEHRYKTGVQLAVVTVNSLEDNDVADYAVNLGNKWGVGHKGADNGIIILICSKERKMNISTGYGIESTLTDAQCKEILTSIKPLMKEKKYTKAVISIIDQIHKIIGTMSADDRAEWTKNQEIAKQREKEKEVQDFQEGLFNFLIFLVFASVVGLVIFLIIKRKRDRKEFNDAKKNLDSIIKDVYSYLDVNPENKDILGYILDGKYEENIKKIKVLDDKTDFINKAVNILTDKFNNLKVNAQSKKDIFNLNNKIVSEFSGLSHLDAKNLIKELPDYIVDISCENTTMYNNFLIVKKKYNDICSDIDLKHTILNTKRSFTEYETLIKSTRSIESELSLTKDNRIEQYLKDAKDCYNTIQTVIIAGNIDREWNSVKKMWKSIDSNLQLCKDCCEYISETKSRYLSSKNDITKLKRDIESEISETENKCNKSGVKSRTKNKLSEVLDRYNRINFSGLSVLETIALVSTLNNILSELYDIKKDAKREHSDYNSSSSSSSSTYVIGSFGSDSSWSSSSSSDSSSSSNDSYGSGSFGGGGSSDSW